MRINRNGVLICSECGEEYPDEPDGHYCPFCITPHTYTSYIEAFYYAEDKPAILNKISEQMKNSVPFLTLDDLTDADPFFREQFEKINYDW